MSPSSSSARLLALAIVARVPVATIGLLLVLAVYERENSYAVAGATSAAAAIGMAVGGPVVGRLIDRHGQQRMLLASSTVAAVSLVAFALLPPATPAPAALPIALVAGAAMPPVAACARAIWSATLERRAFNRVVALDASLQELAFMGGPLVMASIATAFGPTTALLATAATVAGTAVPFALSEASRRMRGGRHDAVSRGVGVVRLSGVRTLVLVCGAMGLVFGSTEIGVVVAARHHDAPGATGVLLALWGAGSIVAGLLVARRPVRWAPGVLLTALLASTAVATAALAAAPGLVALGVLIVVAGAGVAPLFAAAYSAMARVAPETMHTEAFTLQTSGIMAGVAIGSALSGLVVEPAGAPGAFVVGAVAAGAGAVAVALRRSSLQDHVASPERVLV